jgi:hypothetical protein
MRLARILELVGQPVAGLKVDIRSRLADGSLMYDHQSTELRSEYMSEMVSVTLEQPKHKGEPKWLYWRHKPIQGGCGYSGVRMDCEDIGTYHILIEESPTV